MKSLDEFSVKTLELAGIGSALQALRLPFGKECRSDFEFNYHDISDFFIESRILKNEALDKDIKLMSTLIKNGDDEGKVARGIIVWFEINAPRFFHQELDTYRMGAERLSSESTMHMQCQGMSTEELVEYKENLPEGTMQKRVWMMSYQTLRRVYRRRHVHRLPHWHKFCDWIETLPFAKELILVDLEDKK